MYGTILNLCMEKCMEELMYDEFFQTPFHEHKKIRSKNTYNLKKDLMNYARVFFFWTVLTESTCCREQQASVVSKIVIYLEKITDYM